MGLGQRKGNLDGKGIIRGRCIKTSEEKNKDFGLFKAHGRGKKRTGKG